MPTGVLVQRLILKSPRPEVDFIIENTHCDGARGKSGAALRIDGATVRIINVTISGAQATEKGGAIYATVRFSAQQVNDPLILPTTGHRTDYHRMHI